MAASVSSGASQNTGQSTSQSTSTPVVVQTPQSQWSLALSQALSQLGAQQYQWAHDQYGQLQGITDDQINNYMKTGQYGLGLAANNIGRYENIFQPVEDKYVQNAESYASDARKAYEMGMAESDTGQAMDQGLENTRSRLESYGIDPSSGRYADLLRSNDAAKAAAQAGAGNVARRATEATGNQMLLNAAAIGQQYPGQAINALNSTYQGIAGAENAALGTANTGVGLTTSAAPYFGSATSLTPPAQGQASSSTSQSTNQGTSQNAGSSVSGDGSGGAGGKKTGGGSGDPGAVYTSNDNYLSGNGMGGGSAPAPGQYSAPGSGTGGYDSGMYGGYDPTGSYNDVSSGYSSNYDQTATYGNYPGGYSGDYSDYNTGTPEGGAGYNEGGGVLPSGSTSGGHVPEQASPSMGQMEDDIPARLNAGEFVVPRDVAAWKGQEFFQKLIDQARAARTGAPAKASKKPPLPNMGKPSFVSRPMGGQ